MKEYTQDQINLLSDAMWQLLDDMGKSGTSVCVAAKAQARIAFEPFREDPEYPDWMSLAEAQKIQSELF